MRLMNQDTRKGKRWTAEEDQTALDLRSQGLSWKQIARALGRTQAATVARFDPHAFGPSRYQSFAEEDS